MKAKELQINIYKGKLGGRRPNAGRKRKQSRGIAHEPREKVSKNIPLHVNFKYKLAIKNKDGLRALHKAIRNARSQGLKIMHFSLQHNHVHLIVEAANNELLSKGMRSLTITMSKAIAKGRIQIQRYHLHVLRSLRERRNAIRYVLFNERKHTGKMTLDSYSTIGILGTAKEIAQRFKVSVISREFLLPPLDNLRRIC